MKNDPRSGDHNLCNCVNKPEFNPRLEQGEPVTSRYRNQLSYEAADVGQLWVHMFP